MSRFFLEIAPFYLQMASLGLQIKIFLGFIFIGILICQIGSFRNSLYQRFNLFDLILAVFVFAGGIFASIMAISYGVLMISRFNWFSLLFMIMWLYSTLSAFVLAFLIFPPLPERGLDPKDHEFLDLGPDISEKCD